ncbi:MAG: hypothetical protein SVX43_23260 [Cyanobacteriota bacterium]|nr:hypothetical protein [Cyanobacteriota bacterium]
MSKRRNPKKEKALRNKAYARRFRKSPNGGRYNKNKRSGNGRSNEGDREEERSGSVEDSSDGAAN